MRISAVAPAPARIGLVLNVQVVFAGQPETVNETLLVKVAVPVGVTVKVEVVDWPASAAGGVVGLDKVKVGAVTVTVAEIVVDDEE